MNPSDHDLLCRTCQGDSAAAESLWRRHAPRLRLYAHSILRDPHGADDVVQSVFCRIVAMRRKQAADVRDVPAWLAVITRRECLNTIRAARSERSRRNSLAARTLHDSDVPQRHAPSLDAPTLGGWTTDPQLARALDRLPRRHREVIMLRDVLQLSFDQLAVAIGIPRSTASSRHETARRSLVWALGSEETKPATRASQSRPVPAAIMKGSRHV